MIKGNYLVRRWHVTDIIERAKERDIWLYKEQAKDILWSIDHNYDCNIGISWDVIDYHIDCYIGR